MGIMTFGDMPADPNHPLTDDMKDRVMHAHVKWGKTDLMFSDTYEGMPYQPGNTIQMAIHPKEEARAREIFAALEDRRTSHYAPSEDRLEPLVWASKGQVRRYFPSECPRRAAAVI